MKTDTKLLIFSSIIECYFVIEDLNLKFSFVYSSSKLEHFEGLYIGDYNLLKYI